MSRTVHISLNDRERKRLADSQALLQQATNLYNQLLAAHSDRADVDPSEVENVEEKDGGLLFTIRDAPPAETAPADKHEGK